MCDRRYRLSIRVTEIFSLSPDCFQLHTDFSSLILSPACYFWAEENHNVVQPGAQRSTQVRERQEKSGEGA
jgi:hypothetical protein